MSWGVAFAWHVHPWEDLLDLVRRAEEFGYAAAFVDGDVTMLKTRKDAAVLDGIGVIGDSDSVEYQFTDAGQFDRRTARSWVEQLAVARGNHAATSLYERLGFEPFEELRTLLFI